MFKKRVLALFVMLQVVFTSMFPAPAYAATYAPEVVPFWGVTGLHVVQGVSNRFDAALGLIGEWGKKIQISNANYVALSNEGSGGAFYTLASAFSSADPNPIHSPEGVTGNPVAKVAWTGQIAYVWANYGSPADWLWYCNADDELISAARTDFLKVLNGESLGPSGPSDDGDYYTLQCKSRFLYTNKTSGSSGVMNLKSGDDWYYSRVNQQGKPIDAYGDNKANYHLLSDNFILQVPKAWFGNIQNNVDFDAQNIWATARGGGNGTSIELILNVGSTPVTFGSYQAVTIEDNTFVGGYYRSYDCGTFCYASNGRSYTTVNYTFDGQVLTVSRNNNNSLSFTKYSSATGTTDAGKFAYLGSGGGSGGGDNHWPEPTTPEPDPNPTNPEPDPDPPESPIFDPPGFDPPGFSPDVPVTIVPPDNTTAADYTPWLRAILTALNTIIDDMGEHCDHIRVAMRDYLSGMYEAISDDLESYYNDLTDYLSDLAKWIVSHLNFDVKQPDVNVNVPGYDDSSVVGWLRRIYYKLGGSGSPKPDPIEDTDGALDWWAKFLEWITNALGGLLTDFVGDLGGFLQELIDTFPFSIPWDIVAMLTLLDAQRATPDFTVTIPAQEGWWDDITVRINLAAYDDAMATVRGMMLIWWMFILVMKTDWMMLLFDGANDAIADFVSRLTGKG